MDRGRGLDGLYLTSLSSLSRAELYPTPLPLPYLSYPDTSPASTPDTQTLTSSSPASLDFQTGSAFLSHLLSPSNATPLSSLTRLDLSNRYLKDAGCATLCAALVHCPHLTVLDLRSNDLHPPSCLALASLLTGPSLPHPHPHYSAPPPPLPSLHTLLLEWNSLGAHPSHLTPTSSLTCLLSALTPHPTLTHLDLRNNAITSPLGHALSHTLSANRSLLLLDLRWNALGREDAEAITGGLTYNPVVEEVRLTGNRIPGGALDLIEGLCRKNREGKAALQGEQGAWHRGEEERRLRVKGWKEMQEELWEASSTIVRLQMEGREKDVRIEGLEERVRGAEERRMREVREVEEMQREMARRGEAEEAAKAKLRAKEGRHRSDGGGDQTTA